MNKEQRVKTQVQEGEGPNKSAEWKKQQKETKKPCTEETEKDPCSALGTERTHLWQPRGANSQDPNTCEPTQNPRPLVTPGRNDRKRQRKKGEEGVGVE